jgi:hypothetical protein
MNAIIVYSTNNFLKAYRSLPPDTWLVWVDKSNCEKEKTNEE